MTDTAGIEPRRHRGPAGGTEPQSSPLAGTAAASSSRSRTRHNRHCYDAARERLTTPARRALLILDQHQFLRQRGADWASPGGDIVRGATLETLFDRYLVKVVMENSARIRTTARLTEIGELVARALRDDRYLIGGAIA